MPTILNAQLKAELEQVRDRLLNEQGAMIQTTIAQTEAELDRVLQQIDLLLGDTAPVEQHPQKQRSSASVSSEPDSSDLPPFDASVLKYQFKQIKPMQAILQVLSNEKQPLSIDDLIALLYEPFNSSDISKARKSVAITTKHAERRGLVQKVQDHPARFQAPTSVKN